MTRPQATKSKTWENPRNPQAPVLVSRFPRFAPVDQLKSVAKPKETRSVSEGFFDVPNKPPTRYAIIVSVQPHS